MNGALPVLALGILSISTGAIFARLAQAAGAPPLAAAAYRLLFAALLLLPLLTARRREAMRLSRRDILGVLGAGAFLALHFATWISSLAHTSVASSVMLVNTVPLWVGLLALLTGKKLPRVTALALALSVCGGALVGYGDFSFSPEALWGDFLALAGGVTFAGYVVLGRRTRERVSLLLYAGLCYGAAALFLCAINLALGVTMSGFSSTAWTAFLCGALIPQLLGHGAVNWALGRCSAQLVAVALLGESIASSTLAYFLFGELPTPLMMGGFTLLLTAMALAARGEDRGADREGA